MHIVRSLFLVLLTCVSVSAEQVTFTHRPAQNGQNIWQHVTVFANTMTTYEQDGNKISRTHNYVTKEQIRRVTILDSRPGPAHKVQVTYEKAQETRTSGGREAKVTGQAVSGKSYIVTRPGDDLLVFEPDGQAAPEAEAATVRENMQFVGRANPVAKFLHGRTLTTGEPIELPEETAQNMMGWKETYGHVEHVTLTLKSVTKDGTAIFDTEMVGTPIAELSSQTTITGQLHIEVDSCRTLATNLKANLAVRQQRGPEGHTFTVSHEGVANIHTQARFLQR